jgi:small subunit ribosomal protein S9
MTAKQYTEGVGRRKTATARVRLSPTKTEKIIINDRPFEEYFKGAMQRKVIRTVLDTKDAGIETYEVSVHVYGGGLSAQADAIKLGIARALVKEKADRRITLKRAGFLKRDARAVERKKFGLRKARRAPQWSNR